MTLCTRLRIDAGLFTPSLFVKLNVISTTISQSGFLKYSYNLHFFLQYQYTNIRLTVYPYTFYSVPIHMRFTVFPYTFYSVPICVLQCTHVRFTVYPYTFYSVPICVLQRTHMRLVTFLICCIIQIQKITSGGGGPKN